jgi:hypothetical protein
MAVMPGGAGQVNDDVPATPTGGHAMTTQLDQFRYFANPTRVARPAMPAGRLGAIVTPKQGNRLPDVQFWIADNGCFGQGYPGDTRWMSWLRELPYDRASCEFATAPDVVGDAAATLTRSVPWLEPIRAAGYPAAFVAQDGLTIAATPWDEFDVLFLGGSTSWKLGPDARALAEHARELSKRVHCGRVNSWKRLAYVESIGCTSADGTYLTYGPDMNLPKLLAWLDRLATRHRAAPLRHRELARRHRHDCRTPEHCQCRLDIQAPNSAPRGERRLRRLRPPCGGRSRPPHRHPRRRVPARSGRLGRRGRPSHRHRRRRASPCRILLGRDRRQAWHYPAGRAPTLGQHCCLMSAHAAVDGGCRREQRVTRIGRRCHGGKTKLWRLLVGVGFLSRVGARERGTSWYEQLVPACSRRR